MFSWFCYLRSLRPALIHFVPSKQRARALKEVFLRVFSRINWNLNDGIWKYNFFLETSKISKPKEAFPKGIIAIQEAIKLILDAIVNHPRQSLPHGTHLSSHCYIRKSFCSWDSLMMFLMMVLYLVSCNQEFQQIIKVLLSGLCVEKSTKIFFGEWLCQLYSMLGVYGPTATVLKIVSQLSKTC